MLPLFNNLGLHSAPTASLHCHDCQLLQHSTLKTYLSLPICWISGPVYGSRSWKSMTKRKHNKTKKIRKVGGSASSKLKKHFSTISSLNSVPISARYDPLSFSAMPSGPSLLRCCLQPLSAHTLPVISAFLWCSAAILLLLLNIFLQPCVVSGKGRKGRKDKNKNKKIWESLNNQHGSSINK